MNVRDLVIKLQEDGSATTAELALHFAVNARTVRNYLHRANDVLSGAASIVAGEDGRYVLSVIDGQRYACWLEETDPRLNRHLPQTPEQRQDYLLEDLLARTDWVTLDAYAESLFVSRKSISSDLAVVETRLEEFGLKLERKPRYGVKVCGTERASRVCLAACAMRKLESKGLLSGILTHDVAEQVSKVIHDVVEARGIHITSFFFQNLVVHIAIALVRTKNEAYMQMPEAELERVKGTDEYLAACEIASELERAFSVDLPEQEIAYIALHLAGRRTLSESDWDAARNGGEEVSGEAWAIVSSMLDEVYRVFRFDFRSDLELRANLARHTAPLLVRLRYGMSSKNPILADIKEKYSLAFLFALEASRVLTAATGNVPSEEEIGYIALAFALALDRRGGSDVPRKNILIVCASGAGSARLLKSMYQDEFGEHLGTITTCDASRVDQVDFSQIDYVFTTVPLKHTPPALTFHVPFFLAAGDRDEIRRVLKLRDAAPEYERYFDDRLFISDLDVETSDEAIRAICRRTMQFVDLPEGYVDLVFDRERLMPTSYCPLVAMPHPLEAVSPQTVVSVAVLSSPIMWGERPVQVVFLVNVARNSGDSLKDFYKWMARFLMDEAAMRTLIATPRYEVLMMLLEEKVNDCKREVSNRG